MPASLSGGKHEAASDLRGNAAGFLRGAAGAALRIPSADGPLTINGLADEDIWKQAVVLPLGPVPFSDPFPAGGQMRAVVRGGYLCLSAWVPETGRLVARSTGQDPVWWKEDLVVWTVHFHGFAVSRTVSVNPLGAYRVESTRLGKDPAPRVLASASISSSGWSAEAAIPIDSIARNRVPLGREDSALRGRTPRSCTGTGPD